MLQMGGLKNGRWVIPFEYIKLSLFIFQPILKSSDLKNSRYIAQNFLVSSEFIKTMEHYFRKISKLGGDRT